MHTSLVKTLAASALVHGAVLLSALVGWRLAVNASAFPVDAVEIAVGEFMVQSGVARRSQASKALRKEIASPVDFAVKKKKDAKKQIAHQGETIQGTLGKGGTATSAQGQALTEWDMYRARLRDRLHQELVYPAISKNLGETGQVKVSLSVLRDGTISNVEVAEPSAFERLNAAAVDTVKRVARLDPFPGTHDAPQWNALVPIDFALK